MSSLDTMKPSSWSVSTHKNICVVSTVCGSGDIWEKWFSNDQRGDSAASNEKVGHQGTIPQCVLCHGKINTLCIKK